MVTEQKYNEDCSIFGEVLYRGYSKNLCRCVCMCASVCERDTKSETAWKKYERDYIYLIFNSKGEISFKYCGPTVRRHGVGSDVEIKEI